MNNRSNIKDFMKYTSLNVLGMIALSCYILADTFFVSNGLGSNGLAALNLAIPMFSFLHGIGLMLGMGGATKYSILTSLKKHKEANQLFTGTITIALACSAIFVLSGAFFSGPLTTLLGADETIYGMTNTYLKVMLLFAPAFILNDVLLCFVRNDGNPKLSMYAMLMGSVVNIILDYLFIFPCNMGLFGAVLATVFAPVISMAILSLHLLKKKNTFHLVKAKLRDYQTGTILSLGLPSFIAELSSGIVIIVFNTLILRLLGNIGVAAYGVIANLSLVVVAIYTGIAQGIQPLVSKAHGHSDKKTIKTILRYAIVTMIGLSGLIYCGIFFFAGPITYVFNSENSLQLQQIATTGLKIYFTAILFVGFNIIISTYFTSTENAIPAQIISLLRGLLLIVPMAVVLSALCKLTGVWLAFPITEGLVTLCALLLLLVLNRRQ